MCVIRHTFRLQFKRRGRNSMMNKIGVTAVRNRPWLFCQAISGALVMSDEIMTGVHDCNFNED